MTGIRAAFRAWVARAIIAPDPDPDSMPSRLDELDGIAFDGSRRTRVVFK